MIQNASNNTITAAISSFGKFNIAANQQKNVSYSTLEQVCSANPAHCTAQFYVNSQPAGSATINTVTGQLVNMSLTMKVHTAKSQHVLRSVVIQ